MFSFLFLNLVVNADFLSNDILSVQSISSELRKKAMNYEPHRSHTVRRLSSTNWNTKDSCMWNDEDKKCHVSWNSMKLAADNEGNQDIKRYVESMQKCIDKDQAACTGECEFNNNATVCHLNAKTSAKLFLAIMQDKLKNCGPMFASMNDECNVHSRQSECSGECQWEDSVSLEVDDAEEMCVEVVGGRCEKKPDLTDPFGLKKTCPDLQFLNATTGTNECSVKEDLKARIDCFEAKCPMILLSFGAFECPSATTNETCASVGPVCSWKETDNKCGLNSEYVNDLVIPDGCIMKPMLHDAKKCSVGTADACTGTCEWRAEHECEQKGAPNKKEGCHSTLDMFSTLLGKDYMTQHNDCRKATDPSACADVKQVIDSSPKKDGAVSNTTAAAKVEKDGAVSNTTAAAKVEKDGAVSTTTATALTLTVLAVTMY